MRKVLSLTSQCLALPVVADQSELEFKLGRENQLTKSKKKIHQNTPKQMPNYLMGHQFWEFRENFQVLFAI